MSEEQFIYVPIVKTSDGLLQEHECLGGFTTFELAKKCLFEYPPVERWKRYAPRLFEGTPVEKDQGEHGREFLAEICKVEFKGDAPKGAGGDTLLDIFNAPEVRAKLDQLEAEVADLKGQHLRAVADLQNARRRFGEEMAAAKADLLKRVLADILPVGDNLYRALELMDEGDDNTKGVMMVLSSFESALHKHGLECIPTVGQPFDPALHDALQQVVSPDHPPGTIVQEFERGYLRDGKLFRAARVIVAAPGSGENDEAPTG